MKRFFFVLLLAIFISPLIFSEEFSFDDPKWKLNGKIRIPKVPENCISGAWNGTDYVYGGSFSPSFWNKHLVLDVKGGNLSLSGILSLMNNPTLSSVVSPFSTADKTVRELKASLPDGSSFSSRQALYSSIKIDGGKAFPASLSSSVLYTDEETYVFSSALKVKVPGNLFLDFQASAGSSVLDDRKSDSWFSDKGFFRECDRKSVLSIQGAVRKESFSMLFSDIVYSDGFGQFMSVYRADSVWKYGSVSAVWNPNHGLRTFSGKELDESLFIKVNLQDQKKLNGKIPFFFKYGLTVFSQSNLSEKEDVLKAALGFRLFCVLASLSGNLQGEFKIRPEEDKTFAVIWKKATVSSSGTWYFSAVQPTLKGSFWLSPSEDYLSWKSGETVSLVLNISSSPSASFSLSGTVNQNSWQYKNAELESGISLKYKSKFLDFSGKVSWSIEFSQ